METDNYKSAEKNSLLQRWLNHNKDKAEVKTGIPRRPEGTPAPLSAGQQRLWFLQQLFPGNPFYHYADAYRLNGVLDEKKLLEAFESVARNDDILRTTFPASGGLPIQVVHDFPQLEISTHDLQHLPKEKRTAEAEKLARSNARRAFNLENGPLTRLALFRLDENEHLLVLTMHHIITDQWSMRLLQKKWAAAYRQLCAGTPPTVANPPVQFADFAHWQRQQTVDPQQLDYWKIKLAGELTMLQLPSDRARPIRPTFRGALHETTLPGELSKSLTGLARRTNSTMFVLMLTAFKTLLHRYSNQTDIVVGTPFTWRENTDLESLTGFLNDTLALRSEVRGEMTFPEVLAEVRKTSLEAFANKNVPFETLVHTLKPERLMSANPLFQVMFLYHHVQPTPDFSPGLHIRQAPFDFGVAKFDLTLYVSEEDGRLTTIFEYAEDLFDKAAIERLSGHLLTLLEGIVSGPGQKISTLPLLTQPERRQLLVEWNDTATAPPAVSCIHHFFEKNAAENPDRTAVIFQDKKLTYSELNDWAEAIAAQLLGEGLEPGVPAGLCTARSLEMVAGILGILKAGGAYLPLDPEYPPERLAFMLKDSAAPIVLVQPHLEGLIAGDLKKIRLYDTAISPKKETQKPALNEGNLAYLIYTSGSTGNPKGVAVTHANLLNSTAARFSFYPEQPGRFLLLSSFAFDSSVAGIFWSLCSGGTLVLPEKRIEQDMERLAGVIAENRVTHTLLLPSLYNLLLQHVPTGKLATLTTVIVAGEACPASLVQLHFDKMPTAQLFNEYGPTEAAVWCIAHRVRPEDATGAVPIGRPIANTQAYIFDKKMQPVPVGVPGELYIGGANITPGYWNRQELTADRFVKFPALSSSPLTPHSSLLFYKTGDLARYRPDGLIEFLGRADQQVKIRGYRIELDEIREVLQKHPSVNEAVVVVRQDQKHTDETEQLAAVLAEMTPEEAEKLLATVEGIHSEVSTEFVR